MADWFSAEDVKAAVGLPLDESISTTLARLLKEKARIPNGKRTKAARYMVAPPKIVERADWVA